MENQAINLSICLSDIDKTKIKKSAKNGKMYINIDIRKRKEPDQFEQDIYAFCQQTKEEREAQTPKVFVGNGKLVNFGPEKPEEMAAATAAETDDLPF